MNLQRHLVLAVAVGATGCTTYRAYDGEARDKDEVAVISGDYRFTAGRPVTLVLRRVDDVPLDIRQRSVEVLPGHHTLLVDCLVQESHSTTRHEIEVSVGAGRRYGLTAELSPGLQGCAEVQLEAVD